MLLPQSSFENTLFEMFIESGVNDLAPSGSKRNSKTSDNFPQATPNVYHLFLTGKQSHVGCCQTL